MSNKEYIDLFFSRAYENDINRLMLDDKCYIIPRERLVMYAKQIINTPYQDFIDYIKDRLPSGNIESKDVTQCSAFSACEIEMCRAMLIDNNPGLLFVEIGKRFPQYVTQFNDGAFRKYGENQVKTASQLGLTFEYYGYWYLSSLGYIYESLSIRERIALLARTILRNPLYHRLVVDVLYKDIDVKDYMGTLGDSTKMRRERSVLTLLQICIAECRTYNIKVHQVAGLSSVATSMHYSLNQPDKELALVAENESKENSIDQVQLEKYIEQFKTLKVAQVGGKKAPYKAAALCAIIEYVEEGIIINNSFRLPDGLDSWYRKILQDNRKSISMPLAHMDSEPFWETTSLQGNMARLDTAPFYKLQQVIEHVKIDKELFLLMKNKDTAQALKDTLHKIYLQGL